MPAPKNTLKARMKAGETLFGCWLGTGSAYMAELGGRAGFDWVLIDGEHGPNSIPTIAAQLQVLEGLGTDVVVRLPMGEDWMIKQALDIGAQTLVVPLVESGADAERLVRATRYAPNGHRGMGARLARASQFGWAEGYTETADAQISLIVQVETRAGYEALDDILAVEGVDGVFIGPADLSADMGFPGKPGAPEVQKVIADILRRTDAAGKVPAIMTTDDAGTQGHIDNGARFLAVGIDVALFQEALDAKARRWCGGK